MVICLERGADLHMAQLMPLSLASVKSTLVFTFLVPAHPGSRGQRAVKWVCAIIIIMQRLTRHVSVGHNDDESQSLLCTCKSPEYKLIILMCRRRIGLCP